MPMLTGTPCNDNAEDHLQWPMYHPPQSNSYLTEILVTGRTSQVLEFCCGTHRQRFSTRVHAPSDSIHTLTRQVYSLALCYLAASSHLDLRLDPASAVHDVLLFQITSIFGES